MIQLLVLFFHFTQLKFLFYLGWLVTYTLYIIQRIYLKYEEIFGKIKTPVFQNIIKEIEFFYIKVLPTFFSNINKELLLTTSIIETKYINLPLVLRILFAILLTLFIIYCILLVTSYLYYYIILQ